MSKQMTFPAMWRVSELQLTITSTQDWVWAIMVILLQLLAITKKQISDYH